MKRTFLLVAMIAATAYASAQQKTDVQAHRGGRGLMPENTIPAMLHAVDLGVRTLELDCVISSDNKVVVSHDVYMSSVFVRKPDGSDITKEEEKQYALYTMTYDSIRKFDVGTKPHPQFPEQVKMKAYKPLLADLIDSVEAYVKKHHLKQVYYNIETKCSPDGDDKYHPKPDVFAKMVMDVIKRKKIAERVTIQSFDVRTLQVIHKTDPKQILALLIMNKESFTDNLKTLGFAPAIYSPYYLMATPELVKEAHDKKVQVLPWTVNEVSDMEKMMSLHVDGIITDYPDRLVKVAGSYQEK
ncbi:glycerophosphodiester phosphodiesterase family protein [Chitinophaga ginsengisoli]|uniref:Glycerophosphoryl diester phosphodiesterase n=1 Tax=Chitinophaga ginsengisoli TaxID=363837 RepID=A0A2P8G2V1_9BACT|nr:glycerophosphodiester phosphodiesterase family protein [Chitinophaga ginsengisoli]PSL28302.1 glycerophosphoryl diester phosphodiesterase [Chitinophaga ginsengisoli]